MAASVKIITRYLLRALNSIMRSIMVVAKGTGPIGEDSPNWILPPHGCSPRLNWMRLSESIRKLADVTMGSPSLSPFKTW